MNCLKESLPQLQQDQLRDLFANPHFILLLDCLKSELAHAQSELLEVAIWMDDTERAKTLTRSKIYRTQKFTLALEALEEMQAENYPFFIAKLNP